MADAASISGADSTSGLGRWQRPPRAFHVQVPVLHPFERRTKEADHEPLTIAMNRFAKEPVISVGVSLGILLLGSAYWLLCDYQLLMILCVASNLLVTLLALINRCSGAVAVSLFGGALSAFGVYVHAVFWTFGPGYSAQLFEGKRPLPALSVSGTWLHLANGSLCTGLALYAIAIIVSIEFRSRNPWF